MRAFRYEVVVVGSPVTVGYYREGDECRAVARQFDLVGTGDSQDAALRQLKELVSDYVESCVKDGTDEFENSYEPADWQRTAGNRQDYLVTLTFGWRGSHRTSLDAQVKPESLPRLSRYMNRLVGADLIEVPSAAL